MNKNVALEHMYNVQESELLPVGSLGCGLRPYALEPRN